MAQHATNGQWKYDDETGELVLAGGVFDTSDAMNWQPIGTIQAVIPASQVTFVPLQQPNQ